MTPKTQRQVYPSPFTTA